VCVICQNAPALLVGAPSAALVVHRVRTALRPRRRRAAEREDAAWAAAARGEGPPTDDGARED
jgi:hypothetical protein